MGIAIITGASSGLGREFVKAVIENRKNLKEIWVIARREELLKAIATEYTSVNIVPVVMDLTQNESYDILARMLKEQKKTVDLLINNAGIGKVGNFEYLESDALINMIELNVKGYIGVAHACLPYMTEGAEIINIASMASFVPNTRMILYGGTKAAVRAWSTGLREELKPRKINVLTVCPGNMDTEFYDISGLRNNMQFNVSVPWLDIPTVAKRSLQLVRSNRLLYIPGAFYKTFYVLSRTMPRGLMIKIAGE